MDNVLAESLPKWVQFVGLGLSVFSAVGVVLAAPTLLQIFFGGPKLNTRFGVDPGDGNRLLIVFLENQPAATWLRRLAVVKRDTIQSLTATFRIYHVEAESVVVPVHQARIYSDDDPTDEGRYRITLPPTYSVAASILVAKWNPDSGRAEIPPTRTAASVPLTTGTYEAQIALIVDGTPDVQVKLFPVGRSAADLDWQ